MPHQISKFAPVHNRLPAIYIPPSKCCVEKMHLSSLGMLKWMIRFGGKTPPELLDQQWRYETCLNPPIASWLCVKKWVYSSNSNDAFQISNHCAMNPDYERKGNTDLGW